jgi:diazepam-binding inhibitor (GABA receptor modulating acyl-CoA-binding protein)
MSDLLDKLFNKCVNNINKLEKAPNDSILLELYGLYKQATIGDINIEKPLFFDVKGFCSYTIYYSSLFKNFIKIKMNFNKINLIL